MEKDYAVKYTYAGTIYIEAESDSEAIERAKQILEEQHGNQISDYSDFEIEKEEAK
jgi:hypothetical protein